MLTVVIIIIERDASIKYLDALGIRCFESYGAILIRLSSG